MTVSLEDFVIDGTGAVKVLDGYRLVYLDEAGIYGDADPYDAASIALFKAWLVENGVSYYGAPKEDFFSFEGIELAEKEGNTYVIMENLS